MNKAGPRMHRSRPETFSIRTDQRTVLLSVVAAVTGAVALTTVACSPLDVMVPSVTRAAMPMPATIVAQTSATTTILRWVIRSAVNIEELFIASSREGVLSVGRGNSLKGSRLLTALHTSTQAQKLPSAPLRAQP